VLNRDLCCHPVLFVVAGPLRRPWEGGNRSQTTPSKDPPLGTGSCVWTSQGGRGICGQRVWEIRGDDVTASGGRAIKQGSLRAKTWNVRMGRGHGGPG